MSLVVSHVEAAVVAADAGENIFKLIVHKLCYPFGVGKELTGNAHCVDLTVFNGFCGNVGLHSSCADNGNINKFADMSNIVKVAVLRHIRRRMTPVPGVICTVVGVEHIVARVLKILCGLFTFLHISADLGIAFFTGKSAVAEILGL